MCESVCVFVGVGYCWCEYGRFFGYLGIVLSRIVVEYCLVVWL